MTVYYISDLHIKSSTEIKSTLFVKFLQTIPNSDDILILGGDIFDLFIGSKSIFRERFQEILSSINSLAQKGCTIFYLEGNHDFHLRQIFAANQNVYLMSDDFLLMSGGKKIWVAHGDLINRRDYGYLFLRFITRTWFLRALIYLLPGAWIAKIGELSSKTSRAYTEIDRSESAKANATRKLFRDYAENKFREDCDLVLIGHSHLKDQLTLQNKAKNRYYFNLGYSPNTIPYLAWSDLERIPKTQDFTK